MFEQNLGFFFVFWDKETPTNLFIRTETFDSFLTNENPNVAILQILDRRASKIKKKIFTVLTESKNKRFQWKIEFIEDKWPDKREKRDSARSFCRLVEKNNTSNLFWH